MWLSCRLRPRRSRPPRPGRRCVSICRRAHRRGTIVRIAAGPGLPSAGQKSSRTLPVQPSANLPDASHHRAPAADAERVEPDSPLGLAALCRYLQVFARLTAAQLGALRPAALAFNDLARLACALRFIASTDTGHIPSPRSAGRAAWTHSYRRSSETTTSGGCRRRPVFIGQVS